MRVAPLALPVVLLLACGGEPVKLAEEAESFTIAAPKSGGARRYMIEPASSQLAFDMEAPIEKIRGRVPPRGPVRSSSTPPTSPKPPGIIHVDLRELKLFKRVSSDDGEKLGDPQRHPEPARPRLARDQADAPPRSAAKERPDRVLAALGPGPVGHQPRQAERPNRKVTFTAVGDFLLTSARPASRSRSKPPSRGRATTRPASPSRAASRCRSASTNTMSARAPASASSPPRPCRRCRPRSPRRPRSACNSPRSSRLAPESASVQSAPHSLT